MSPSNARKNRVAAVMVPRIVCDHPDDVARVEALAGFRLHVRFHDGVEGIVDLSGLVHAPDAGVFAALANPARFAKVGIEWGAVWWPGDIDLAPDAMYEAFRESGEWVLA